jgi:hypothetical protein
MSPNGAGSQRIVVVGGGGKPPAHPQPQPHGEALAGPPRDAQPPREPPAEPPALRHSGWTTRRLTIFGGAGALATFLGGGMFLSKFGVFGANDSPLLAMGFGLFVIGMVVFCASLVALLGIGIGAVVERGGWAPAAGLVVVPLALAWAIYGLGVVGYGVPAVLSLALIGGVVVALK